MRFIIIIFTMISISSCSDEVQKSNEIQKVKIQNKITEIKELNTQFKADFINTGISNLLDLNRLQRDKKQLESEQILKNATNILIDFRSHRKSISTELLMLTDSIKPNQNITTKQIKELKNFYKKMIRINYESFQADSSYVALNKKIVNLLKNRCEYEIVNNQIYFQTQDCIDKFTLLTNWLESSIENQKFKEKNTSLYN